MERKGHSLISFPDAPDFLIQPVLPLAEEKSELQGCALRICAGAVREPGNKKNNYSGSHELELSNQNADAGDKIRGFGSAAKSPSVCACGLPFVSDMPPIQNLWNR